MRRVVAENNVYRWAGKIVATLAGIDRDEETEQPGPFTLEALASVGGAN